MGGVGFSLDLKRTGGDAATPVAELSGLVFRNVARAIQRLAKGKAYRQVTEEYLGLCEEDGAAERVGDQIVFGFKDSGGCTLSAVASEHWFKVVIAALRQPQKKGTAAPLDAFVARRGWRIVGRPGDLKKLLAKCAGPLVEVKGVLYRAGARGGARFIEADVDLDGARSYGELAPKDRARVDAVIESRRCACAVCEALRAGARPTWPKDAPPRRAKARRARYRGHVDLNEPRWKALPDDLLASPEVRSLSVHAERLESLPEGLVGLPLLEDLWLQRTALKRLPEVLGRLPALKALSLGAGAWETLADLPELPRLESLRVYLYDASSPLVATIPWGRVPNLKRLGVGSSLEALPEAICDLERLVELGVHGGLERLPERLDQLKALEELNLDCSGSFEQLPARVFSLPRLRGLRLVNSPVQTLPAEIGRSRLVELSAYCLRALPESLGDVATLEKLSVSGRELRELPASLGRLRALKELVVSGPLEALPDLSKVQSLELLDVSRTNLAEVPKWIRGLEGLRGLALDRTAISTLPDWIGGLPLAWLRVSRRQVGEDATRLKEALRRSKHAAPEPLHVTDD